MIFIIHMHLDKLKHTIASLVKLDAAAWDAFEAILETKEYKIKDYIFKEKETPHQAAFLSKGIARAYYLTSDGNEYNKTFFLENSFPMPLTALITGQPNKINYQALSDCQVVLFNFNDFRSLFSEHECLKDFYYKALEIEWIKKEMHDINMVTNDATTNYKIFKETFPGLDQLIPQYHIASYLGITPIQLSRIRASLYK